ncbi:cytochrome C oxidase subunit IV family protein [Candidatus Parabeggiatoa sp. HSG14]|uniref:cytochrome C oxidase subunit IV family protein n=1 Tax=Candidatus Parabeggiatoa sp. HSG14 TaxID=3055593 RepID=UPI0025A6B813|nr:cytochrome C oxidase subunit IV family protein [Thiotrichales bacterium HSG14]MDM8566499.1 cytochrome C oxidase subunit IV family protein [Candidatus Halobeggiatoa sp. HSG11]
MTHSSTISWSILILLTIFAFIFGGLELGNMTIVSVILLSTIIKSQIVIDYFMGLHQVRWQWRIILYGWLLLVIAMISLAYWLGLQ